MKSSKEVKCCPQNQEEITQTREDDEMNFTLLHNTHTLLPKLKYENEGNDRKCLLFSELNNVGASFSLHSIKMEPEDLQCDFQPYPENVALKEEVDIEVQKSEWELAGIFKDELDQSDSIQKTEFQSSAASKNQEMIYNCAHCPYKTNKGSTYIRHYDRKHEQYTEMYKCKECPYKTNARNYYILHCDSKHKPEQDTEVYKCEECSFETRIKLRFSRHYRSVHGKETEVYKCKECSFETKSKNALISHGKKHAKVYKCEECSFETKYKQVLGQHHKNKHAKDAEVYKCEQCSFETKNKSYLTHHYTIKHSIEAKVYKCEQCSYETKSKSHFTRHYKYKHKKETEQLLVTSD